MSGIILINIDRVAVMAKHFSGVMAGLVPAIHVLLPQGQKKDVDARDKRGHDASEVDVAILRICRC
jgi:hypothetical protein